MRNKRAGLLHKIVIQILIVVIFFSLLLWASAGKVNFSGVKQQVLEKEIALLIDSADSGMEFGVRKINKNGIVQGVEVKDGKVFISVDGLGSVNGYPYFSKYSVSVRDSGDKFVVGVG